MEHADVLRAELATAELEGKLAKAKGESKTCPECGRAVPTKQSAKLRDLKQEVREARQKSRDARAAFEASLTDEDELAAMIEED